VILVVGGRGFVGQAYVRLLERLGLPHAVVTRGNAAEFKGARCDLLINANGNSKKFLADRDPQLDFELSVRSVETTLSDVKAERYVFLSTGDVYPDQSSPTVTSEAQAIDPARVSRYGQHKLLAEQKVRDHHTRWLIVRMGGFVGPGLRKNAVFDMMTGAPVWLSPASELQFISTDKAAELVWGLCQQGVEGEVVNLGARGVVNLEALHAEIGSRSAFMADARTVRFELDLSKLAALSRQALPESLGEVRAFVSSSPDLQVG
jgi:nucleoside-diphosphate-sugar epimerase